MPRTRSAVMSLIATAMLATTAVACSSDSGDTAAKKQHGSLVVLPQISAAGDEPQAAKSAETALVATFKPAIEGRKVAVQRKAGSTWKTVDEAEQGKQADLEFSVPYADGGEPATYRALATGAGADRAATKASRTDVHGAPDFSDEFSGDDVDSSVWNTRVQGYATGRTCSKADDRAAAVGGGTLKLRVMTDPDRTGEKCTYKGKKYSYRLNGHIGTVERRVGDAAQLPTKTIKYGYFAARMKMQSARGQHASFWLQTYMEPGPAPTNGAEIDVVEYFGDDHPQGGVASYAYPGGKKVGGMVPDVTQYGDDWSGKFHVFSLDWTPDRYVFRIDGQETFRITSDIVQVPEFLILSLLPSDWELPLGDESDLPQTAEVDWVRHWKL